jgi:hypothetical protein
MKFSLDHYLENDYSPIDEMRLYKAIQIALEKYFEELNGSTDINRLRMIGLLSGQLKKTPSFNRWKLGEIKAFNYVLKATIGHRDPPLMPDWLMEDLICHMVNAGWGISKKIDGKWIPVECDQN